MIGVVALPDQSPYFSIMLYAGCAGLIIGAVGLAYLWWTSKPKRAPIEQSTTFKIDGNSTLDVDESFSSADTFVDAKNGSKIAVKHVQHRA